MSEGSTGKRKRNVEDDLICPITLELPIDPVIAADGRIYERKAIRDYFKGKSLTETVKSPMTNEPLKSRDLLDATQHRNTIETLIENGAITGELADKWSNRVSKKKKMIETAKHGDASAMYLVARSFQLGTNDFKDDITAAALWADKAHDAGDVQATAMLGMLYLQGHGVPTNWQRGIMYLANAARVFDYASFMLGIMLVRGEHGLPEDFREAKRHLKYALSGTCEICNMTEEQIKEARAMLTLLESYRAP